MNAELLARLKEITWEEQEILNGNTTIQRDLYTSNKNFVIDSEKLLEKGRLIEIRPHTRFIHFPKHYHNYVEMVYMCSGSTTHIINDRERVVLEEGDLLFLNQNASQEIFPAGPEDIAVNFIILPEFFDQTMRMIGNGNPLYQFIVTTLSSDETISDYLHFRVKDVLPVHNLIENMIWNLMEKRKQTNTINQFSMGILFLNLLSFADIINKNEENQYEQNLVFSALNYIDTHYKNGSLEEFCASLHQKTYTVSRMLKRYTSHNFKELLMERKLQQAAYLLSHTKLPTESVYHAVGYENSSFFYNKFKEKYGETPKEYRLTKQFLTYVSSSSQETKNPQ